MVWLENLHLHRPRVNNLLGNDSYDGKQSSFAKTLTTSRSTCVHIES